MTTVTTLAINAITDQGELLHLLGRLAARWRFARMDELAEEQAAIDTNMRQLFIGSWS